MRESAQPVALVTTFLPPSDDHPPTGTRLVHGATLSSFSSISLSPPLLSFAMQTPSRLSQALQHPTSTSHKGHFVLNLLATHQAQLAHAYARPGLQPLPFPPTRSGTNTTHPLLAHDILPTEQANGVPRLTNALGSFVCHIVDQINLSHYNNSATIENASAPSILYIAQITHVFRSTAGHQPLLYYHQHFVQPGGDVDTP